LSEAPVISFREVTKYYAVNPGRAVFLKDVLLHFPRSLVALRRRERFCALDRVSFDVARGECFGVIGRNGSGKSTTLGLIARVLTPNQGSVRTVGRIAPLLELGAGFHFDLTGRENIILNGVLLGMTRDKIMRRVADIVAFSELEDLIERPLRGYSSGMVARLGFSVAVHLDPDILLVDEVLAVGDEGFQQKCLRRMAEFRARGVTMVLVSHNLGDIESLCDRAALLDSGRLAAVGRPGEVVAEYRRRLAGASPRPGGSAP
jgi:lipopolysaccharide transport system ATP-binding protein